MNLEQIRFRWQKRFGVPVWVYGFLFKTLDINQKTVWIIREFNDKTKTYTNHEVIPETV